MDPRIRRTKVSIIDAFLELLSEKNFNDITVSDITRKARIARPTFYLHYKTKQDLLVEYLDEVFKKYLEEIQPVLNQKDQYTLSIALFNQVQKNEPYLRSLLNGDTTIIIQDKLHQYMQEVFGMQLRAQIGKRSTLIPEDVQKFSIAAVAGMAYSLIVLWLEEGMQHDPEYMGKLLYTVSRPGIVEMLQKSV